MDKMLILKDVVMANNISDDALCVYAAICKNFYGNPKMLISSIMIENTLFGRPGNKKERKIILNGINELIELNYLKLLQKYNDNGFECDISKITYYDPSKIYASIFYDELVKIMSIKDLRFKILRYFLMLILTFDNRRTTDKRYKHNVGYMPINYLSAITGISSVTITKYNNILKENEIIYISRRRSCKNPSDNSNGNLLVKWETNVYSRYEHKDLCEEYAKLNGATTENVQKKQDLDKSRKYVQMYNYLVAGKEYDHETILEIYDCITNWNKNKIDKYNQDIENGKRAVEPKLKDLSIFEKYGLAV